MTKTVWGMRLLSGFLAVALWGCGGKDGEPGANTVQVRRMNLRSVEESNPLLAERFRAVTAGYSIRPPGGWLRKASGKKQPNGFAMFTNPKTLESLSISASGGGLIPDVAMLTAVRDGIVAGIKKHPGLRLIGIDMFSFDGRYYVQALIRRDEWINLQLMVYPQNGRLVAMDYWVKAENYRLLARALEASIASLALNGEDN